MINLSKTCMKYVPSEYLQSAIELHLLLYIEGKFCQENLLKCKKENCSGEWTFDYVAEGHFCSGECNGYDGIK